MNFIRIVEWEKYQHYKDRNPPWIKLHRELMTSNTWVSVDDASRVLAIAIMMLAAATGNKIPANPAYVKRVAYLNSDPDFSPLAEVGFIEIVDENGNVASAPIATASTKQADARPEKRQSRAEQSKTESAPPALVAQAEVDFEVWWKVYPKKADKGHAREAFRRTLKRGVSVDTLVAGAQRYRDDPKRKAEFTKNGATWLVGECWSDETVQTAPAKVIGLDF
jgi:hypothetical protein